MKELMNEWRKYVKEIKDIGNTIDKLGIANDFIKGMMASSKARKKEVDIIVSFVENSHKINNIFEEALKLMGKYDFDIAPIFRPDPKDKEIMQDSDKYFQCARDIVVAIAEMVMEEGESKIIKSFKLPNTMGTGASLYQYEIDAKKASRGKGFTMSIMSVRHVIEMFNQVAYEISKDPEKMRKMKERDTTPEMKPYDAPEVVDLDSDLETDFALDSAKRIRNRDTYNTEKEINENKRK